VDFDAATLDSLKRRAKRQLRQRMQSLRGAMPPGALATRSNAIVERLLSLPEVAQARSLALFFPMEGRGEVDLSRLDAICRARGAAIYYPTLRDGDGGPAPGFCTVAAPEELEEAGRGFREPPRAAPLALPGAIDVIVVPALAVSELGYRLGYGSGFYDRVLPKFRPPARAVAVAYDFQLLAELPSTDDDIACDVVVTDARVVRIGEPGPSSAPP
jgi:5-formyltetrahydrofolate cyclo-ligase